MNFHLTPDEYTQENSSIISVAHVRPYGLQCNVSGLLAVSRHTIQQLALRGSLF